MKKFLIFVTFMLLPIAVSAYDFEVNGFCYTITSSVTPSVKVTYKERIPGKSDYYSGIVNIPERVLYNNINFVVDEIGEFAFYGSTAEKIIIPNSVKRLGVACFEWSDITSISIPGSIETISAQAFWSCYNLEVITLSEGIRFLDEDCFGGGLRVKYMTIPSSVETINSSSFYSSVFPDLVFSGEAPTIIHKSGYVLRPENSVAYVKEGEIENFRNKGWNFGTFIEYDNSITDINPEFSVNGIYYKPTALVGIYQAAAIGCENNISSITISNNVSFNNIIYQVSSINNSAFNNKSAIKQIRIAGSVKKIGDNAFANCTNLKVANIEEGVEDIGCRAFYNTGLSKIVFPSTTGKIGEEAFVGCQNLNKIYSKIHNPFDADNVFSLLTTMMGTLYVPVGTKSLYETKLGWKQFTNIVETDNLSGNERGDVNGDAEVNIADINAVIDQILSASFTESGDVNGDAEVNIADINAIIDMILSN